MTRMTGSDCAVMCNSINTHIHTHTHTTNAVPKSICGLVDTDTEIQGLPISRLLGRYKEHIQYYLPKPEVEVPTQRAARKEKIRG